MLKAENRHNFTILVYIRVYQILAFLITGSLMSFWVLDLSIHLIKCGIKHPFTLQTSNPLIAKLRLSHEVLTVYGNQLLFMVQGILLLI